MRRSEIQHHFPTLYRVRRCFAIRLPRLSKRTCLIVAVIVAVVFVDRNLTLRRRVNLERARGYREAYVRSAAAEQTQLKTLKFAEGADAGFEQAIAEAERRRDAATDGPGRYKWEERLKERRSLLASNREEVVPGLRKGVARTTAERVYFQELMNKYLDAASHPWRSVPPDPPWPE
jgi:hypothetical protein